MDWKEAEEEVMNVITDYNERIKVKQMLIPSYADRGTWTHGGDDNFDFLYKKFKNVDFNDPLPVITRFRPYARQVCKILGIKWSLRHRVCPRISAPFASMANLDLYGARLEGSYLFNADFSGANLSCACLRGADLSGVSFYKTDLRGANLAKACLSGAETYATEVGGMNQDEAIFPLKQDPYKTYLIGTPEEVLLNKDTALLVPHPGTWPTRAGGTIIISIFTDQITASGHDVITYTLNSYQRRFRHYNYKYGGYSYDPNPYQTIRLRGLFLPIKKEELPFQLKGAKYVRIAWAGSGRVDMWGMDRFSHEFPTWEPISVYWEDCVEFINTLIAEREEVLRAIKTDDKSDPNNIGV